MEVTRNRLRQIHRIDYPYLMTLTVCGAIRLTLYRFIHGETIITRCGRILVKFCKPFIKSYSHLDILLKLNSTTCTLFELEIGPQL